LCLHFSVLTGDTALGQAQGANGTRIAVYVSGSSGDRLARKKDAAFGPETKPALPVISVNDKKTFQTIEGFGATFNEAGMICLNSLSEGDRTKVYESLFDPVKGAGYTLMKSPIAACDFASAGTWYSYDETAGDTMMTHFSIERDLGPNGLVNYIKTASGYGKFRIESPMDFAPDWMYFSLKKGEKHIRPLYYSALARYYSRYLQEYRKHGVQIDYLNLFNEAENEWYSNESYKEIGELIKKYVRPRLISDGVSVNIQFGETANRPEAIKKFPAALDDPALRKDIHSLTVHGYDWDKFSTITDLHHRYPELPIWQTEVCYAEPDNVPKGGPAKLPVYGFEDGEFWGKMIANDMRNWSSAWIYWNMILDERGGPWLVSPEHGDPDHNNQHPVVIIDRKTKKVYYTGLYYYLAHFSKFIRPGAKRIDCTGSAGKMDCVAFHNTDGSIVVNIINSGEDSVCTINWENKNSNIRLAAHSITTLKWQGGPDFR
jgi:glucosylceramidase